MDDRRLVALANIIGIVGLLATRWEQPLVYITNIFWIKAKLLRLIVLGTSVTYLATPSRPCPLPGRVYP